MKDTAFQQCPFCGQYMMNDSGIDVREACACAGAKKYQNQKAAYDAQKARLDMLCGDGCAESDETSEEARAVFKPVSEEAFNLLESVLYSVVFGVVGKTKIELSDGTSLTVSADAIERRATVKHKLG